MTLLTSRREFDSLRAHQVRGGMEMTNHTPSASKELNTLGKSGPQSPARAKFATVVQRTGPLSSKQKMRV